MFRRRRSIVLLTAVSNVKPIRKERVLKNLAPAGAPILAACFCALLLGSACNTASAQGQSYIDHKDMFSRQVGESVGDITHDILEGGGLDIDRAREEHRRRLERARRREEDEKGSDNDASKMGGSADDEGMGDDDDDRNSDKDRRDLTRLGHDKFAKDAPDNYDGDEFKKSDFIDTDFRMRAFIDLKLDSSAPDTIDIGDKKKDRDKDKDRFTAAATGDDDDKDDDLVARIGLSDAADERSRRDDDFMRMTRLSDPDAFFATDWAPAPANRLHNGGFGKTEDNGRPVPYRLSGHVGIQRGFPWDKDKP